MPDRMAGPKKTEQSIRSLRKELSKGEDIMRMKRPGQPEERPPQRKYDSPQDNKTLWDGVGEDFGKGIYGYREKADDPVRDYERSQKKAEMEERQKRMDHAAKSRSVYSAPKYRG